MKLGLIVLMLFSSIVYPGSTTMTESSIDIDGDGKLDHVQIVFAQGEAIKGHGSCGTGETFRGKFSILVNYNNGTSKRLSVNQLFGEDELSFYSNPWNINFADYNHDGKVDFNLGQYGSCNGGVYKLFTFAFTGEIRELVIANDELRVSDNSNSTGGIELTPDGFSAVFYSNVVGHRIKSSYHWDAEKNSFTPISKQIVDVTE
jgi:hypothetical protein